MDKREFTVMDCSGYVCRNPEVLSLMRWWL